MTGYLGASPLRPSAYCWGWGACYGLFIFRLGCRHGIFLGYADTPEHRAGMRAVLSWSGFWPDWGLQ